MRGDLRQACGTAEGREVQGGNVLTNNDFGESRRALRNAALPMDVYCAGISNTEDALSAGQSPKKSFSLVTESGMGVVSEFGGVDANALKPTNVTVLGRDSLRRDSQDSRRCVPDVR